MYYIISIGLEYAVLLISVDVQGNFFGYSHPYRLILYLIPWISTYYQKQRRNVEFQIKIVTALGLLIQFVLQFVIESEPYVTWNLILSRLLQGPAMIEFVFCSLTILVNVAGQVLPLFMWNELNGFFFEYLYRVNFSLQLILIGIVSIFFKQKVGPENRFG